MLDASDELQDQSVSRSQVNSTDVTSMGHTEVVDLVRAAPRLVDLVVGRVLDAPKPPIEAHLLPDICYKNNQGALGELKRPRRHNVQWSSSSSFSRFGSGRWERQHVRGPVCERDLDGIAGI